MLLRGDINFRLTNKMDILIIAGCVPDAGVVGYESVSVSMSKLETLPHSCNSNWTRFS